MSASTIVDIRATPVTVPLQAPLLHSNGAHWGRFVRTVVEVEVEVETADGYVGQGEVRTAEQLTAHLRQLKAEHGLRVHKLKGGVYPPRHELACCQVLAAAVPGGSGGGRVTW